MKKIEIFKLTILILILLLSTLLVCFFHIVKGEETIFTHFFYAPIILAAFWYQFNVVWVVLYLSLTLVLTDIYSGDLLIIKNDIIRSAFFVLVGLTVAFLRKNLIFLSGMKKYRSVMSSIQESVLMLDSSLAVTIANEKFLLDFGRVSDFLTLADKLTGEEKNNLLDLINRSFNGGSGTMTCFLSTLSGEIRFFEINSYPITEHYGIENVVINMKDLTEKRASEAKLQLSLDRKKTIIDVLRLLNRDISDIDVVDSILDLLKKKTGAEVLAIRLKSDHGYNLHGHPVMDEDLVNFFDDQCRLSNHDTAEWNDDVLCLGEHCLDNFTSPEINSGLKGAFRTNDITAYAARHGYELCSGIIQGGYRSILMMPLWAGNEATGFIFAIDKRAALFGDEGTSFFEGIVPSFEIALNRMKYEDRLRNMIDEKESLIREVHHRVKNNMQVITSLISLQSSRQKDEHTRHVLNECQNRVRTMALVHEKLYNSDNFSSIDMESYTDGLVGMLMRSYNIDRKMVDVEINVSGISLDLNTAIPLAQLLNELVTNSYKHAFSPDRKGFLKVSISKVEGDGNAYRLCVKDNGPGLHEGVSYPDKGNLGFQLIYALVRQIRGKLVIDCSSGTSFQIDFNGIP